MNTMSEMLEAIRHDAELTADLTGRQHFSEPVMEVLGMVPRHRFLTPDQEQEAYYNIPLPIGHGQTISQPYIVALMTDLLNPQPEYRCLEIGTGSGYQAAILSLLVTEVHTVEIVPSLYQRARSRLQALGYSNVHCHLAGPELGCPEQGPFDGILVAAAPERLPEQLLDQLKPGGRLIIPVGPQHIGQTLYLIRKNTQGEIKRTGVLPVRFVPLLIPEVDNRDTIKLTGK